MPIVNGSKVMQAVLYTGTGATQTIAVGFQPDLVWIKSRSAATDNKLTDSVRGATKALISNSTAAETTDTNGITAFTSNGFTLGSDSVYNTNGATYVAWCWQAGQGTTSSNTNGSITSTVSVNASAGFSVVTYTGTGAAGTIGHGLGVAPYLIIYKNRSSAQPWLVQFNASTNVSQYLYLNTTDGYATYSNYFKAANSTTFGPNTGDAGTNGSGNSMVAYCWTPIAGFSAFGSYTGNGSTDGPFVYTGFRPAYIMIKSSSTGGAGYDWFIQDTARNPANTGSLNHLWADSSVAENDGSISTAANNVVDVLSNGFKSRYAGGATNGSGITFIYIAFASNPFKNSLAF